jgi:hypothetical protein
MRLGVTPSTKLLSTKFPWGALQSQDCKRYYGRRYGYFDLLPNMAPFPEKIDPDSRFMKVCATRQTHSYMAITRPKNTASDAKNLWCWHCYECNKGRC